MKLLKPLLVNITFNCPRTLLQHINPFDYTTNYLYHQDIGLNTL